MTITTWFAKSPISAMDFWEDDAQTEDDFLENWSVLGWAEFSELEIQQSFDGYPLPGFFQFANWKMAFWSHGLEKPFSMVILSTVLFFFGMVDFLQTLTSWLVFLWVWMFGIVSLSKPYFWLLLLYLSHVCQTHIPVLNTVRQTIKSQL